MTADIIRIKRRVRPLKHTYSSTTPYVVDREDQDDGSIFYEVSDERPESYRLVCGVSDDGGTNAYAKHDAEQIARGLNLLVQYGMETLPSVRDRDDHESGEDND